MNFSDYIKFCEAEEEDLVSQWQRMRQQAGLTDRSDVPQYKPQAPGQEQVPSGADVGIPSQVMDVIASGFKTGGIVPDQVVKLLKLNSLNYSLVADSSLTSGGAYPFVKDRRAGSSTGRIRFAPGFSVIRFLDFFRNLQKERG